MTRNKILVLVTILLAITLSGCSLGFGKRVSSEEAAGKTTPTLAAENVQPTVPVEIAPTPVTMPTETPLPLIDTLEAEAEKQTDGVVSLLGGPLPEPTLPAPGEGAAEVIRQSRYNAIRYNFEPAAGWEMKELGPDTLLIRRTGDEGVFDGAMSTSPYIYLQYTDWLTDSTPLADVLADMTQGFDGVQQVEDSASPVIDGLRGLGRFVDGQNEGGAYRAWLVVFPLQGGVLRCVFRGSADEWATVAPEMNSVLTTMRWPKL